MALVRVKQKFQVTIPAWIRDQLHLAEGEFLDARMERGRIVLTPQSVVNRADIDAAIDEGLEDVRMGRVTGPFKNAKEFRKVRATKAYKELVARK